MSITKKLSKELEGAGCGTVIAVLLLVGIILFGAFCLSGLIIYLLWNNVVVTLFPNLPVFGYWLSVGISCALTWISKFIRGLFPSSNKDED